jgi:Sec-independent protein secretion pathway component TatC
VVAPSNRRRTLLTLLKGAAAVLFAIGVIFGPWFVSNLGPFAVWLAATLGVAWYGKRLSSQLRSTEP